MKTPKGKIITIAAGIGVIAVSGYLATFGWKDLYCWLHDLDPRLVATWELDRDNSFTPPLIESSDWGKKRLMKLLADGTKLDVLDEIIDDNDYETEGIWRVNRNEIFFSDATLQQCPVYGRVLSGEEEPSEDRYRYRFEGEDTLVLEKEDSTGLPEPVRGSSSLRYRRIRE